MLHLSLMFRELQYSLGLKLPFTSRYSCPSLSRELVPEPQMMPTPEGVQVAVKQHRLCMSRDLLPWTSALSRWPVIPKTTEVPFKWLLPALPCSEWFYLFSSDAIFVTIFSPVLLNLQVWHLGMRVADFLHSLPLP